MRTRYLIGPTTALLAFFAIAVDSAPALAGAAVPIYGSQETFVQIPCGGDLGLLGNVEAEQVEQSNPMNVTVCEQ